MKIRCNMPPDHDARCPWEHANGATIERIHTPPELVVVAHRARRRFLLAAGCFTVGWGVAGFLEHYGTPVLLDIGILVVAFLVIAWLSDRIDT